MGGSARPQKTDLAIRVSESHTGVMFVQQPSSSVTISYKMLSDARRLREYWLGNGQS